MVSPVRIRVPPLEKVLQIAGKERAPVIRLLRLDEGVDHLRARRSSSLAINVAAFLVSRAPS
jgi:hypothetical protein